MSTSTGSTGSSPNKSPKNKPSVRFTIPPPSQPLKSPVKHLPPTVKFEVPHTRDYLKLLHQTKMVYDQLLAAKQSRLVEELYKRKQELDSQCNKMNQADQKKMIEFGVEAQETLNKLQTKADDELSALHIDYQNKLNKMKDSLEEKWLSEHAHDIASGDLSYKYFPKKA